MRTEPSEPASEQSLRRKIVSEEIILGTANTVRKSLGYTPGAGRCASTCAATVSTWA